MLRGSHKRIAIILFLAVYLWSGLSRIGTSFDSRWTVFVAMSIWNHGDTNLDEYSHALHETDLYAVECVDAAGKVRIGKPETCEGHWYNSYPVGGPVLVTPLIAAAVGVMKLLHPLLRNLHTSQPVIAGFLNGDYDAGHALIEMEVASMLLAASAVMIYSIGLLFLPVKRAVWLAILFATATSAYSVAGRAVWQHTPSMLLMTIILYLLLRSEERPSLAGWAGLPVALAYTMRPTDSLWVVAFTVYVAVRHRRYLLYYLLAAAPVAAVFVAYNFSIYHNVFSPYYRSYLVGFLPENWPRLAEAMAGNLVSPSRGLFIFTPVFLFAIVVMLRRKLATPLAPYMIAIVVVHWVCVSAYVDNWWAGHSYGPRFFTDLTPIFVLFLIPWLDRWGNLSRAVRTVFVMLALIGFAIHLRGGWSLAVIQWNIDPKNIDLHPERNWDWGDPPFLRWRLTPREQLPKD